MTAVVVRCHRCNMQTTIIDGPAPELCDTCGGILERRPDAQVEVLPS